MRRTHLFPGLAFLLAPAFLLPSRASAHYTGCDAVDSGEIRWTSSTIYGTTRDWAITQWTAIGPVRIVPDNLSTSADLWFRDVNRPDKAWAGAYTCLPFGTVDPLKFNRFFMDSYTVAQRNNVATHELGHALNLGHSVSGQVMFRQVPSVTTLQRHDIDDYCARWGCWPAFGGGLLPVGGGGGVGGDDDRPRIVH